MGFGSRVLKLEQDKMKGDDVLNLQTYIVAFGSKNNPVPCNGVFDSATESAVKKFQKYFSLAENGIVNEIVYKTISDWFAEMHQAMETFLSSYKCDHSNVKGENKTKSDELWTNHVKDKLPLIGGGKAGDSTTCTGFGNNLTKVALTKEKSFTYKFDKDLIENPGIDKRLFWLIMGILKIYGTKTITVNNGYRCNYKYWQINKIYGPASLDNHTGHAVDFTLPGADLKRPNKQKLTSDSADIITHCKEIRTDLEDFGIVETFDITPKNRGRTEPGKKANGSYRNWVHIDTTIYEKHEYIQSVEEAMATTVDTSLSFSFPVIISTDTNVKKENIVSFYNHTEKETEGGYFPVGSNTLWHGGLHIFKDEGTDVFACMPGKVIAGRLAEDNALATGPFGHRNFLLLEHTVKEKKCFSLYMHLKDNPLSESDEFVKKVKWLQGAGKKSFKITGNSRNYRSSPDSSIDTNKLGYLNNGDTVEFVEDASPAPWKKVKLSDGNEVFLNCDPRYVEDCTSAGVDKDLLESLKKGDVVKIDKEIQAGDLLWKIGKYGPKDEQKGLVHWEIFSEENLVAGGDESETAIEDKKPEGVSTGYTAAKGIKVRGVTGPAKAKEGQTVTCIVTKIDYSDAPATELDKIKWDISIGSEAAACSTTGYKLEYTIPESSAGKTIKIRPYINSPSDNYCVATSVITGWTCIEDPDDDFNAENEKIVTHFGDLMADGTLTREELKKFFADNPDGKAEKLRSFACKFASEWGVKDLAAAIGELKKKGFNAKEEDYKPYLWWKEATDAGVILPSPNVWHYNPIRFLEVFGTPVAPSQSAPAAQPAQPPVATVGIKKCEGPATVLPGQKIVCKVTEYTKTPTDTDKKKVSWCVKLERTVVKEEKNKGEQFEFTVPETAAGATFTIHPFMNSPSDSVCVKTVVGTYLLFNGAKLTLFDKELKEVKSWKGVSGQPGFQKPENQGIKDKGPIPEGYWYVKQSELQHIADQSFADSMAGKVGRGTWPGGEDRWGKHRVWLSPVSGTDTKGRDGFCINGGKTAGSAGSIDLTGDMNGFADVFEKGKMDLILVVNYSSKKNRILGRLSSQYETGGRGSITVSSGAGDAGGVSYGAYQMTSKPNGGNVTLFVQSAEFPWKSDFVGLVAGTTVFSNKWKEIVTANKDKFVKIEHEYIQLTHYDPLVDKIKRENNIDITEHSDILNDVVWSTAVQHGKSNGVVGIAINKVTVPLGKNKNYDRELIKAIYAERGRKKDDGNLYYFSKNSKDVQDGVSSRFQSELAKALKELENENY